MPTKCFQLYLCDEAGSYESMCPTNASPIYTDTPEGRWSLWRYMADEFDTGGLELDWDDIDIVRAHVLEGDPLLANLRIRCAFIIEWEIVR